MGRGMGRRRAAQNIEIKPWLSARKDCREGRFIQVGNSLLLSKKFQELTVGAQMLYLCAAMESAGRPEFTFPRSAALKYSFSENTAARHIKELTSSGFIELLESGRFTRTANRYRFSLRWKEQETQ